MQRIIPNIHGDQQYFSRCFPEAPNRIIACVMQNKKKTVAVAAAQKAPKANEQREPRSP
jgi:hypothetical protein